MKHITLCAALLVLATASIVLAKKPYKAVVIVPIADAAGSPIKTFFSESCAEQAYNTLPICGGKPLASSCCPRLHQLLFNEIGTVIKEEGQEVLIKISNCFYSTEHNHAPQHAYWTLKKNIMSLKKLEDQEISIDNFPAPISFYKPSSITDEQVVTLVRPWNDEVTNQTFSAGTRFLKVVDQKPDQGVSVHIFNAHKKEWGTRTIPSSFLGENLSDNAKKIELFISLLKKWAHPDTGYIPYVWGGCSFTATAHEPFNEKQNSSSDTACTFYEIKNFNAEPKPGFDCSNLIMRAAQVAGIPFFFKNSHTMTAHIKKLHHDAQLSAGDIIWIPGHVLIVADTNKNTVIEARGYKYKGQGRVQEIALNKIFKGIHSFEDLVKAWHAKQPLERLSDDGSIIEIIKHFKLLSMQSIME